MFVGVIPTTVPSYQAHVRMLSTRMTEVNKLLCQMSKAMFTQRSLSDLTLDQSKVRSDKVCVNTLNRIGKPDR